MPKETELQIKVLLDEALAYKFIKIKERYGLKTHSETIRFLIAEEYRRLEPELTPDLEYFNTYEDHVTIRDNRIGLYVDIFVRDGKLYCSRCEKEDCEHIQFAINIPKVKKALEERGWKY